MPCLVIERPEKFGGTLTVKSYEDLRELYLAKKIHPLDLKVSVGIAIDSLIAPVRAHFETNKKARALAEQVRSFDVTR